MNGYALVFEGFPHIFVTAGISAITSYSDEGTAHTMPLVPSLLPPQFTITERMRPIEGTCEVNVLDFAIAPSNGDPITAQWTADEDSIAATYLTADATDSATTITVARSAAVGSLPRIVWVGREAMLATAAPTSTTLTVDRAQLGTRAQAYAVDAARAITHEVRTVQGSPLGARVRFYRVDNGAARLRWVGYVADGPVLAENGATWVVSCAPAAERALAAPIASQEPAATMRGYDAKAFRFAVVINDGTIILGTRWASAVAHIVGTFDDALRLALDALSEDATFKGATEVIVGLSGLGGGRYKVSLQYDGLDAGDGTLSIAGDAWTARVWENSGRVSYVWDVEVVDGGALARPGFAVPGQTDRATVIAAQLGARTTSWGSRPGSQGDAVLSAVLRADLSDDAALVLDPTGQSTPGYVSNDTAFATVSTSAAGEATFHALASVEPRDLSAEPRGAAVFALRALNEPVTLYPALRVTATHWLDAVRSVLEDDSAITAESDSRDWGWSGYSAARRVTRDALGPVSFTFSGGRTVGDFVSENAKLRGACVAVRNGLLTVLAVREPRASDTPVTTLGVSNVVEGTLTQWTTESAPVTSVTIESPVRSITIEDAVAIRRHGVSRDIAVMTDGYRANARAASDPTGLALAIAGPLLSRWRKPVGLYTITVPSPTFEPLIQLGDVIDFASFHAPDGAGVRAFTNKRGVVIGRTEDLGAATLALDVLALPLARGFSPCCRVASIAGAQLTIAGGYVSSSTDYAGSTLAGYQGVAGDYGVGWFAAGDTVRLVQRDSATLTVESYTVASVDTALRRITLTTSVNTSPTNWASLASGGSIVDVVFDDYAGSQATQRVFAAVADETTGEIVSGVRAHRWAP
jgi:hypothetical protein